MIVMDDSQCNWMPGFPPYVSKCTYITFYLSDIFTALFTVQWKRQLFCSPSLCQCSSTL